MSVHQKNNIILDVYVPENEYTVHGTKWSGLEGNSETVTIRRRSTQSILKEISPGCSLEGMMLKLKLQYSGHLMRRVESLEKTDAGRDWGQEEKDELAGWHHQLDEHESG